MKQISPYAVLAITLLLTGCSSLADDLGIGRNSPDEFAVVDRPPLSLPPDFTLKPPQPGAPRPQEIKATQRAEQIILGENTIKADSSASESEQALLQLAGADKSMPNIRNTIDRESAERVTASKRLIDDLLWWKENRAPDTTLIAAEEAKRIRDAKAKGQNISKGATPVIERDRRGWLGL